MEPGVAYLTFLVYIILFSKKKNFKNMEGFRTTFRNQTQPEAAWSSHLRPSRLLLVTNT